MKKSVIFGPTKIENIFSIILGVSIYYLTNKFMVSGSHRFTYILNSLISYFGLLLAGWCLISLFYKKSCYLAFEKNRISWALWPNKREAINIDEISSVYIHKSPDLIGYIQILTKFGKGYIVPGNCYEAQLVQMKKSMKELAIKNNFSYSDNCS